MATKIHLKHTKSSATTANTEGVTIPRLPSSGDLLHGEIAINYRDGYEGLFIKNSSNHIVPFPTNSHFIDTTKLSGLINGQIGMDANGAVESFYIYNAFRTRWQPVSTNYVDTESELDGLPVTKDPQFAYVADTGLMYFSRYDTVSSQTWVPMAKLDVGTKELAFGEETSVVITGFDDEVAISENSLIYDSTIRKLKKYGLIPEGEFLPELVAVYSPSKNVVYYNKKTDKFFIWTGSTMKEIKADETPIFSANTGDKTILYALTVTANTASHSYGSIVLGQDNLVSGANWVTIAGVSNIVSPGGDYSFVEGHGNKVSGDAAHAEGVLNKAYGNNSHAEGSGATASGNSSHAEGYSTNAIGDYSHAEGSGTIASGNSSHAEGYSTRAIGDYSHAEGYSTSASGAHSHAEGRQTKAIGVNSHAEGSATTASGTRSHAEGLNNVASGENSHVGGRNSLAAGRDSFAHGYGNSAYCAMAVAMGSENRVGVPGDSHSADAASSVALGRSNSAMGYSSFVCGHYNYADGMYSNAFGETTSARGFASHSEGFLTDASAMASHAEGAILPIQLNLYESDDPNYDARAIHPHEDFTRYTGHLLVNGWLFGISATTTISDTGYLKVKSGNEELQAMVSGHTDATPVYGQYFDPNDSGTVANGIGSHSEGFSTYSEGQASHTEGSSTSGFGDYSHAEGSGTCANGRSSHAEGHQTHANGADSHAEGVATHAEGRGSHAGGNRTSAISDASCALGSGTVTNNAAEFACGKYNVSTTGTDSTMFSVGVGSNTNRKNALEIRKDGKIYIYDNNGNQVCLQDILQTLQGYHS